MSNEDTLMVLGASYDSVEDAEADYEAVKSLYQAAGTSHDFDAAVIDHDESGKVRIVKTFEESTRFGAGVGLGLGLAVGAAFALFPAIALAGGLAVGGISGAVIGAVTGHIEGGLDHDDLKQLGETLEKGQAGLIIVYETNMADQVAADIKAVNRFVSKQMDADLDQLVKQIKTAESE